MARCKLLFLALSLTLLLSGCLPKAELKKTAIVQAIGIDVGEQETFAVTLQTYNPKTAGSGGSIDTAENNAGIIAGEGKTISEAMHNATVSGGKELFTGYNRLIIIGRPLAERGIEPVFSYFDRSTTTRQNVDVLIADGRARDIVSTDIKEGILAAEMIERMLADRVQNGYISNMPYYKLSKNMYLYGGAAVLPLIQVEEQKEEEGKIPDLKKMDATQSVVLSDYRLAQELTKEQTRGSVLLHDELRETVLVTENEQGEPASVQIYECKVQLSPRFEGEEILLVAEVDAIGTLDEVLEHGSVNEPDGFSEWEQGCETVLEQEMTESFQKMMVAGADVLYLSELIRAADLKRWEALQSDDSDWLKRVRLQPKVQVNINRIGMQTNRDLPGNS